MSTELNQKPDYKAMYDAMDDLAPCPHCGQERIIPTSERYENEHGKVDYWYLTACIECKARTGTYRSLDAAITAWNKRADS